MDAMVVPAVTAQELRQRQAAIVLHEERAWLIAAGFCIGNFSDCPCSRHPRMPPSAQGVLDGIG